MISKSLYLQLIFRVVFLVLTTIGMTFFYFENYYFFTIIFLLLLILQTSYLIYYVNQTNRKIAYFFEAIKNEDFTLRFPEKLSVKSLEELNHSLNTLNEVIQDIHLKKQAQEQYYQEIIKQANIGIMTFNKKGHILYANPKIEELLSYTPLNHIKQLSQVDHKLYELFNELKPFDRKLIQLTNEREKKQIAIKSTLISLNHQELTLVVAQNIHQELDEKETDSWMRLIRVLTHEIMNTITPIISISESVLKYYKKNDDLIKTTDINESLIKNTVKGLEVIKDQGGDFMAFVESYRSFLSLPKPDKKLVSAESLLSKISVLMADDTSTNITLKSEIKLLELEMFIDEKQISQILINLCKNAYQSLQNQENGIIKMIAGKTQKGNNFIEVQDNGPGIPEELIDEIFVPFFTTKDTGTGIGLSLSKQIIHLHGGTIEVYSIPFIKTSFLLVF